MNMNTINAYTATGIAYEIQIHDLTGTPKQVSWANSIRKRILTGIMDNIVSDYVECITRIMSDFDEQHTAARYWIDNDRHADSVVREFNKFAQERL